MTDRPKFDRALGMLGHTESAKGEKRIIPKLKEDLLELFVYRKRKTKKISDFERKAYSLTQKIIDAYEELIESVKARFSKFRDENNSQKVFL